MSTETRVKIEAHERELLQVVRRQPAQRVSEVIDFAQFLEFQMIRTEEEQARTEHDDRWEALLATEESQRWLEKMADEVRADVEAGRTRFLKNGVWTMKKSFPGYYRPTVV